MIFHNYNFEQKVKANLSIDAIEITLFHRNNSKIKNLFIFFIIPLNDYMKPFTIRVFPNENGKAGEKSLSVMDELINELFEDESPINLQYSSVDGDSGYNSIFELEFNVFFDYFSKYGIEGLTDEIERLKIFQFKNKKCLINTDMVHFLKNRRTDIIIKNVILNGHTLHVECLEEILHQSAAILDKSQLSKIQDTFPIEIFNFKIFAHVLSCRNDDLAFWMFPMCCWNECFNNQRIGKKTRLFLLECGLYGFKKFFDIQNKLKKKLEIMPQVAIKRAFCTIAISYKEFKESDGIFLFAQIGTMLQEHYHGLIRGMSKGVDSFANTVNCIAKSNIILDIQAKFQMNFKKKTRYSVGGIHFDNNKTDYIELECDLKPKEIIDQLEQISPYGRNKNVSELFIQKLISFTEEIGKYSLRILCTNKHFHYGRRIISREITNARESKNEKINDLSINNQQDDDEDDDSKSFENDIKLIEELLHEEEEEENE